MKMRRRSWRVLVSAGIPSMVYLAIHIGNPDWPFMSNVGWALLNGLFIFPGILAIFPLMFLTFGMINIHDYPFWMPETFGWTFWTLFLYGVLSFYYRTPPHWASGFNANLDVITALLDAGVDPSARDEDGKTPLHDAARSNQNPDVITALLDAGVDHSARDKEGKTPLHDAAASNQNPDVIAALLDAGADPSARDKDGKTPLHDAAGSNQNPGVIAALLDAGADPSARDKDGKTPLHDAADSNQNPDVIAALLDAGADPSARDEDGRTPWDLAKDRERIKGSDAYRRMNDAQF